MEYEYEKPFYGIFEIVGLSIKSTNEKDKHIFKDALILNGKEMKTFFKTKNDSNNNKLRSYDNSKTYLLIVDYIGEKDIITKRANQIISFLSFVTLVISNFQNCVSLKREIYKKDNFDYQILDSNSYNKSNVSISGFGLNIQTSDIITSRKNLKKIIKNSYFNNLFYLIDNNKKLNYNYLIDSLNNFYITFNNLNTSFNYLGAVISLEMLLKGNGKYEDIKTRLKILLSEKVYEFYNSVITFENMKDKDIFQIRNEYVHSGKEINTSNALKSLMFTSIVIIAISNLLVVKKFKHQKIMIKYLDECYLKSKFEYFDNNIKIEANDFTENFLPTIYILNYIKNQYEDISDLIEKIEVKKNDFKIKVKTLMEYKNLNEKDAYNLVNSCSLELNNAFKSYKEYLKHQYIVIPGTINTMIQLMKEYTHPLHFHNYK